LRLRPHAEICPAFPHHDSSRHRRNTGGTILLYIYVQKGFFPVQDTGVILGVSEGPQDASFAAMSAKQRALADVILKGPAGLRSFVFSSEWTASIPL